MEKLLLIDGHSILNRAYYALPPLSNSKGVVTNAVLGFLNIMFKFAEEEKPDYLAVAFDEHGPTFRHEMFSEYKGTRKKSDPEFAAQVPMIQELLSAMGIPVVKRAGIEADDILGTLAKKAQGDGLTVTIVSGDRDLLQLCDARIKISLPKTSKGVTTVEEYDREAFILAKGVTPLEFIDVKALMGDSGDNIPGVPGIGEKGAYSIISAYHSIEEAHAHWEELKPKKASENLRDFYDRAVLSKTLATIKTDCELEFDLSKAAFKDIFTPAAYSLCLDWELKSLLKKFPEDAKGGETFVSAALSLKEKTFRDIREALAFLGDSKAYGLVYHNAEENHGFALSTDKKAAFLETDEFYENLRVILDETEALIITDALKDSLLVRVESPLALPEDRFFDVTIARYLLDPTRTSYELYAPGTASMTAAGELFVMQKDLTKSLDDAGLSKLFYEVEMPLVFTLSAMEREGIYLDTKELSDYNEMLKKSIIKFENEIYGECGEIFNINSPKQLGEILFGKMGIPGGKKTKTGYSTAADVLEKLAPDYPVINKILLYRQYSKLKSTYAEGLSDCVAGDGRVHTTFRQTVTATGRLSSTDPNLQNIPIRTELGRMIRKVFKAKPGHVFIDADYSQIELRVLAHMSGDDNLIESYRANKDIHRATAAKVFNKPFEEVTDFERSSAKAVNFGIVYGISSYGLGADLNISRVEASKYIEDYYKAYPSLKAYLDNLIVRAKKLGYASTMYGRIRPIPELKQSNFMQRSFGERVAMNMPIQGTAADIIKIAMNRVRARLLKENLKAKLILQVHDELLIEAPLEEKDQVTLLLREEMENAADLKVPLVADVHCGENWFLAK